MHLWSFLRLQGRRLWLRDRQVRLREWGLRRQGQRRVPLWANLQVRQRLLRVLHGQVLQHGQLPRTAAEAWLGLGPRRSAAMEDNAKIRVVRHE